MLDDTPLMDGEKLVTGEDGLPTKVVEKNFWQKYVGFSIYMLTLVGCSQELLIGQEQLS
jgi:hypothetical protein